MEWLYLGIAGAMEVLWSTFLKFSEGFTKPMPTVITLAGLAASMFFLAKAAKVLPIGTAYGIWTGIGALVILSGNLFNIRHRRAATAKPAGKEPAGADEGTRTPTPFGTGT